MISIYIIRNSVNDKVYIGSTNAHLSIRLKEHRSDSKLLKYESKLMYAMREINVLNFSIHLLETCNKSNAREREAYWIKKFDSVTNGYNTNTEDFTILVYTVDGVFLEELNSLREFGRKYNFDWKAIQNIFKGTQHRIGNYTVFKKSGFTEELLKERLTKIQNSHHVNTGKPFEVFKDGISKGIFYYKQDCADTFGLTRQAIGLVLNGKRGTHKGYTFSYLD